MSLTVPTLQELDSFQVIASVASKNPSWRKLGGNGSDEQIVATILSVMLLARELGINPMVAISGGINNIQGKFELSARIINQLIRQHGHKIVQRQLNDKMCTLWGKRKDTGEEMEVTYHIEEAQRCGLVRDGSMWKKCPQDMLFARCISRLGRRLAPDALGGCYVEGELQETMMKQTVEEIESVPENEIEVEQSKEEITFDIPDDIEKESLATFIAESAHANDKTPEYVIGAANANPDRFISALRKWHEAQIEDAELVEA